MFTGDNFRRIYDRENRRGNDLAGKFFPNLDPLTQAIRHKVADIRNLRADKTLLAPSAFSAAWSSLKYELRNLKAKKSQAINKELDAVSVRVRNPTFKLTLTQSLGPKGKFVYSVGETPEAFFVSKQLQENVRRIYQVKQANRHHLASALRDTISCRFPYELVRTDVSSFYESVDRRRLLSKLDEDQLLSTSSKKFIRQILESYSSLTGERFGLPRGAGISAYLAELFMQQIDRDMRCIPGLTLYCRFVDDIVAVFARPHEGEPLGPYETLVIKNLQNHGLICNNQKTLSLMLDAPQQQEFEYLGYRFVMNQGACVVHPSQAKLSKYEVRIEASFNAYKASASVNPRKAYRDLVARIRFLTGNTRLVNSKSGAVTGIYYNNPLVTDQTGLQGLDQVLKQHVMNLPRPKLRKRLKQYRFTQGFAERRFHLFSTHQLRRIVEAWKHA
jgi:hypothetical protein